MIEIDPVAYQDRRRLLVPSHFQTREMRQTRC
jgi:hypothetical protein